MVSNYLSMYIRDGNGVAQPSSSVLQSKPDYPILSSLSLNRHMDINFFSVISVTKLALPLLKKAASKGLSPRIVTVSSISALIPGQPLSTGKSSHTI